MCLALKVAWMPVCHAWTCARLQIVLFTVQLPCMAESEHSVIVKTLLNQLLSYLCEGWQRGLTHFCTTLGALVAFYVRSSCLI